MNVPMTSTLTARKPRTTAKQRPFTAYGAGADLWACRDIEVVIEGPAGTGKSRTDLEKLHYCAMKYAGMRGLIVRKTRESMTESSLVTWEDKVVPADSPITAGAQRRTRQSYTYPNGSTVVVGGMVASGSDQRARIMSTEYDMIVAPEANELTEHEWEQLITRLRNGVMPYQQIIGDINPDAPTHWLHQRCDKGTTRVFFSRHEDNPMLYDHNRRDWTTAGRQYVFGILEKLSGVRKERLRYGRRAAADGTVYEFDRAVHLVNRFEVPTTWRRVLGIDFGYTNPFVAQDWAIDGDGRAYLVREIYMSHRLVAKPKHDTSATPDHASTLRQWISEVRYERFITDHDAEDRETLERALNISTTAAYKAVSPGIQTVEARMQKAGDGKVRLFIMRDALVERDPTLEEAKRPLSTEQEFDSYMWPKGQDGKPNKEAPVKVDDHGMDTMRYVMAYVDDLNVEPSRKLRLRGGARV
jgi:hypothetical protein